MWSSLLGRQDKGTKVRGLLSLEYTQGSHPRLLLRPTEPFVKLQHECFESLGVAVLDEVSNVVGDVSKQTEAERYVLECFSMWFERLYRHCG